MCNMYIGVSYRLLVLTNVEKYTKNTLSSYVVILSLPYYCKSIYTHLLYIILQLRHE